MDLTPKSTRDAFGDTILELAQHDNKVVALTADLAESLRLTKFREVFPERFFDVGVAEQNLVGISAGLALEGFTPYATSFGVFSPGRNWDQIRVSIAYNNANVKIIGGYAGFSNGKDGATHQALEDIALMRTLPNMVVIDTVDYKETVSAIKFLNYYSGPAYLRIRRDPTPSLEQIIRDYKEKAVTGSSDLPDYDYKFELGKGKIIKKGKDVTIISCGVMLLKALEAAMLLEKEKISARVINLATIKPIDREIILECAEETKCIVTIEDHQYMGGMGSAVSEVIVQDYPVVMKIIGVNNQFGETGITEELWKSKGLTVENIIWNVKEALKLKKKFSGKKFF